MAQSVHGTTEGKGLYNEHAKLQADGIASSLRLLEEAARNLDPGPTGQPVVIADYGSSQGKNSMAPLRAAISVLHSRLGADRAILVYHVDLPANDFNSLFAALDADHSRYTLDCPNVFPCAIGRSFYGSVLPESHVNLGWSSYAAVWLSKLPLDIPDHFFAHRSTKAVHRAFDLQAAKDWEAFLTLRSRELRPGGRLVIVLPGLADDGLSGFEGIFDHANAAIAEMVNEGVVSAEERARMALTGYPRREADLLAPFSLSGRFHGLTVEHLEVSVVPDTAWASYREDGNREELAAKHALFFRATFLPSLAAALDDADANARRAFGDRLEQRLKRRLEREPVKLDSVVQTIILAKIMD